MIGMFSQSNKKVAEAPDPFDLHKLRVLSGEFSMDDEDADPEEEEEEEEEEKEPPFLLEPHIRTAWIHRMASRASASIRETESVVRKSQVDVESAMRCRSATVRSFAALVLVPFHEGDEEAALEAALDAFGIRSRRLIGQSLVDKRKSQGIVTVDDLMEHWRVQTNRVLSIVHLLTDRQVAGLDWAYRPRDKANITRAVDRNIVETLFLDNCIREDRRHGRKLVPCCVYRKEKSWLTFKRRNNRAAVVKDAITLPCSPLLPWSLFQGIEAHYEVTFFPCRIKTPYNGILVAVLACDWDCDASCYLARFVTEYHLRVSAPATATWQENVLTLDHIHKPLLTEKFCGIAAKVQDERMFATWEEDNKKLLQLSLNQPIPPPTQQYQQQQQEQQPQRYYLHPPPRHRQQRNATFTTAGESESRPTPAPPAGIVRLDSKVMSAARDHDVNVEPHRSSLTSAEDSSNQSRFRGLKRLRSSSQGPVEDDLAELDVFVNRGLGRFSE